jgi:hypothetical protein
VHSFRASIVIGLLAFAIGLAGCDREDPVSSYSAPKEPTQRIAVEGATAADTAGKSAVAGITWTVPAGWVEQPPHESEKARFLVSGDDPNTSFAVTALGPGMDLAQNVNRWEKQLGLAPSTADEVKQKLKTTDLAGTPALSVELKGESKSIRGVIVPRADRTWFIKLMGPTANVTQHAAEFDGFLKSVRFAEEATESANTPPSTPSANAAATTVPSVPTPLLRQPPPAAAVPDDLPFTFTAPAEWKLDSRRRQMRLFTYLAGPADKPAEVFVSPLTAAGFDLDANLARWRRQVGLPDDADASTTKTSDMKIGGRDGTQVDLSGPTQRLIVAFTGKQTIWFFKIQGPSDVVEQQKQAFETFLSTVKFKAE